MTGLSAIFTTSINDKKNNVIKAPLCCFAPREKGGMGVGGMYQVRRPIL